MMHILPAAPAGATDQTPPIGAAVPLEAAAPDGLRTAESSWRPFCGESELIREITIERWAGDLFKIKVWIKPIARSAPAPYAATVSEWHAIQACVSGLGGGLADSIWDQLECHQRLALVPSGKLDDPFATGESFDPESWRGTFDIYDYRLRCGSALHEDVTRSLGDPLSDGRPDAGVTDLAAHGDVA